MRTLKQLLNLYKQRELCFLLFLGISSGVPFLLILSTFSYWLNELQFSVSQVSIFTAISLPYSLKMFWAPYLEKKVPPLFFKRLGHKKGWGILSQIFLCIFIFLMGLISPDKTPFLAAVMGGGICFFSASQDIIIDGLRIEYFSDHSSGIAASFSGVGFHIGKLISGCGTLYLAHSYGWQIAYQLMVLTIIPGMIAMTLFHEKKHSSTCKASSSSIMNSLKSLSIYKNIQWMILFIALFKIGDAVLQGTAATFLYELGLSKIEFANLTKIYGTLWMVIGSILGGIIIELFGIYAALFNAVLLQSIACLLFAVQAHIGYDYWILSFSIGIESLSSGLMMCTLIALISRYVNKAFSMSHYTLFYAVGSLSRVLFSTLSGIFAQHFGWIMLYSGVALFIIPIVYILLKLQRYDHQEGKSNNYDKH